MRALTEVLEAHRPYGMDCKCGEAINSDAWWAAHVAKRIETELQLTEEKRTFRKSRGHPIQERVWVRRWVSVWSEVES
jgi:hypothetical protein